ncbi:hypothetical protein STAQ_06950 [Allostella sp. ATCC 35155]|nr:hypothetical protein STAQ_06950 [Stella sp. ATCC 35155]
MASVLSEEVTPGLVVYLDPDFLKECAGCLTNVVDLAQALNRPGPFLVLLKEEGSENFLTVPLYTDPGRDGLRRELLRAKVGAGVGWLTRPSYWHQHHFWIIPATCFPGASTREINPVSNRKRYALDGLPEIIAYRDASPIPFRPPIPN